MASRWRGSSPADMASLSCGTDLAGAYHNRGLAYLSKGDYDRAIADLDKAIQLGPGGADAYNNRGCARGNKRDYDLAIADFDKAIQLKPDLARAYFNRGYTNGLKVDHDLAIADFDNAIQLKPDCAEAYKKPRNCLPQQGRPRSGHRGLRHRHPAQARRGSGLLQPRAGTCHEAR